MGTPKVITQAQQYTCKLPRRGSPPLTFHSFIMKAFAVVLVLCLAGLAAACSPPHTASTWSSMLTVAITWKRFSAPQTSPTWGEGVDGSSLSEEELNKYSFLTEGTRAKLLPAELGAALSHISIWRKVAASSAPLSLVFEDDVVIPATFLHNLESTVSELPENWDIMYLSYLKAWEFKRPEKYSEHLVQPNWPLGFYAYAITPAGAQRLLNLVEAGLEVPQDCVDCGIDAIVASWIHDSKATAFAASPELCYNSFAFKTVIGNRDNRIPRDLMQAGSATPTPTPSPTPSPNPPSPNPPSPSPPQPTIPSPFSPTEVSSSSAVVPTLLALVAIIAALM